MRRLAVSLQVSEREAERLCRTVFQELSEAVSAGRFEWPGFGVWEIGSIAKRQIVNPTTHELMRLPKMPRIKFRAAQKLKRRAR